MVYFLNIKNSYPRFLCLDNSACVKSYFSCGHRFGDNGFSINIENIEVNIDEKEWYEPIVRANPSGVIAKSIGDVLSVGDFGMMSILLRKAKLNIENVKSIFMEIDTENGKLFNSIDKSFDIGDKYIWLSGNSSEYYRCSISLMIIFSGDVLFSFEEGDIVIQTVNAKEYILKSDVECINTSQELFVKLKGKNIEEVSFNNVKSPFFNFEYQRKYIDFTSDGNFAIKEYRV